MSHCIEKPIDKVLALKPCWHGLETIKEVIDSEIMRQEGIFFPLRKEQTLSFSSAEGDQPDIHQAIENIYAMTEKNGVTKAALKKAFEEFTRRLTVYDGRCTVVGDLSEVRPDLVEMGHETRIPFNVPKDSYGIISNERAFETIMKAFGADVQVVTAGTLNAGKVFFVSLDIGESICHGPRNDEFQQYLEAVTSHDGTIGTRYFDSGTRMVCMNTVQAALHSRGNLDMTVYHTKYAEANLDKVSVDLADILTGRRAYFDTLGSLDAVSVSQEKAKHLVTAFLATWNLRDDDDMPEKISTQIFNKADEAATLFTRGAGNRGATLYDVYNAVTELYTWGSGTGKNASKEEKFLSSRSGTPAQIKQDILPFLNRVEAELDSSAALGEKLYKEKAATM